MLAVNCLLYRFASVVRYQYDGSVSLTGWEFTVKGVGLTLFCIRPWYTWQLGLEESLVHQNNLKHSANEF